MTSPEEDVLDLGFATAREIVAQIAAEVATDVNSAHVNDPNALSVALCALQTSLESSMSDVEEENTLLVQN